MNNRFHEFHGDQKGAISIVSLFALLLLTMLLGMVTNVGRQVDSKIKMQNAADAITYSSGVVVARGMNTLAFTNHLVPDVFALTAFLREARDRNAEQFPPQVLAEWNKLAPIFGASVFPKFKALGDAIPDKTQQETELIRRFSVWMHEIQRQVLPVMEEVLSQEMIPQFQRTLIELTPQMAQATAADVARRHGGTTASDQRRGQMVGVLWRPSVEPIGSEHDVNLAKLPALDLLSDDVPLADRNVARARRDELAHNFLRQLNSTMLGEFRTVGKMSQFYAFWDAYTCGQLNRLLDEYKDRNLPFLLRPMTSFEEEYVFLGVSYWRKSPEMMPTFVGQSLFENPIAPDPQAFAQGMLFVPRRRLMKGHPEPLRLDDEDHRMHRWVDKDGWHSHSPDHVWRQVTPSMDWDLWNQNWTFQLMPATADSLASILQTVPTGLATEPFAGREPKLPRLSPLTTHDIRRISPH